jgi:CobQ-like glutamine amidotransferase family enzyme
MNKVTVALLHPLLTVACGDDANGLALAYRARQRSIHVDVQAVHGADPIPEADVYLLGGSGQVGVPLLAEKLAASDVFTDHVAAGAVVLAIDAGLDALGRGIADERGQIIAPGLGLLGFTTGRGREISEPVVTDPVDRFELPALGGWVQHHVSLRADPDVEPFVRLEVGHGDRGSYDGVVTGHIVGTRLHGPLLGRNPEVADLLLAWATGREMAEWEPLPVGPQQVARDLRAEEDRAAQRGVRGKLKKSLLRA